ncbi:putative molybdopterin binding protein [Melghirimyces profundicolus]|uniref:Molybdopterin molybdenumtransferase n=1 Tax=Melghirimyces profundicolus TaxID=1242148 RepID=A0A2T6BZ24_9BACL|nr:molybdopterin-binding protein [Melghirimyces profundicolus]PTX61320.1 putative molybdopterin binding protein [Melghirimyces profundicolus]
MKEIPIHEAVGMKLGHDVTRIVPEEVDEVAFPRGHVIREKDIPVLKSIGKFHIFVMDIPADQIHEEEAALKIGKAIGGAGIELTAPSEGRVNLIAEYRGLVNIDRELLRQINSIPDVIVATIEDGIPVKKGDRIAGTRIIPLTTAQQNMDDVRKLTEQKPLISVHPFQPMNVGMISTGTELYEGFVSDGFKEKVSEKLSAYDSQVSEYQVVPDDQPQIVSAIKTMLDKKIDLLLVTGGMSVDPDDRTPGAIRAAGVNVISYGVPVLPGSMCLVGYDHEIPVLGLPGCVIWDPITVFDRILPWVAARKRVNKADLVDLGYGGLLTVEPVPGKSSVNR